MMIVVIDDVKCYNLKSRDKLKREILYWFNIRKLDRVPKYNLSTLYILGLWSTLY